MWCCMPGSKAQWTALLATLPEPVPLSDPSAHRRAMDPLAGRAACQDHLAGAAAAAAPVLVWDNLTGHHTPELVLWLFARGVMVLYTPLSGSWLNMAESIQRILGRRALDGQHPETTEQIIAWLEATARGWNADPTPFVWGGKRAARRARARERRHALAGSGAYSTRSLRWTRYGYARRK